MSKPAIFLDRDGTLIEEVGYLRCLEDLKVCPKAFEALEKINRSGTLTVVVTNQSAIARGLLTEKELLEIHRLIGEVFQQNGVRLDAFYFCPHHPEASDGPYTQVCTCRKPEPGLLLQAARELGIDLAASHMIGDRLHDVEAGHRAGCRSVLVKTGYGKPELQVLEAMSQSGTESALLRPDYVAEDLLEAVDWILEHNVAA